MSSEQWASKHKMESTCSCGHIVYTGNLTSIERCEILRDLIFIIWPRFHDAEKDHLFVYVSLLHTRRRRRSSAEDTSAVFRNGTWAIHPMLARYMCKKLWRWFRRFAKTVAKYPWNMGFIRWYLCWLLCFPSLDSPLNWTVVPLRRVQARM